MFPMRMCIERAYSHWALASLASELCICHVGLLDRTKYTEVPISVTLQAHFGQCLRTDLVVVHFHFLDVVGNIQNIRGQLVMAKVNIGKPFHVFWWTPQNHLRAKPACICRIVGHHLMELRKGSRRCVGRFGNWQAIEKGHLLYMSIGQAIHTR